MAKFSKEEKELLLKLASGVLDSIVGDDLYTAGKSKVWMAISGGIPQQIKQGPSTKYFNGEENIKKDGITNILKEWVTDEEKLQFLQKFGWLIKDDDVKSYSAKYKPKV